MSTIFSAVTSELGAAVTIIRISGPDALELCEHFSITKELKPRYAYNVDFIYQGELLDNGIIVYFKAPNSFTGEDVIELNIHGGRANIVRFLSLLENIPGYRHAEAGEFSKRAFLNNKIDLLQAEAINDLVKAETSLQAKQAVSQLKGKSSHIYNKWRDDLIEIMAFLEAYIDFPDEDLPDDLRNRSNEKINNLKNEAIKFIEDNKIGEKIRDGIKVAIIGKTNAGKSSLLNYLAGRDVAITSDIAGTTRDVIDVHLDLSGLPVIISDTAGIRKSEDVIEKIGIEKALDVAKQADVRILLLDGSEIISEADIENDLVQDDDLIIVNKSEIIDQKNSELINNKEILTISIKEDSNINELIKQLEFVIKEKFNISSSYHITRERHKLLILRFIDSLELFNLDNDIVLSVENLRVAANSLAAITGRIDVEDILDKIFSSFCIGK